MPCFHFLSVSVIQDVVFFDVYPKFAPKSFTEFFSLVSSRFLLFVFSGEGYIPTSLKYDSMVLSLLCRVVACSSGVPFVCPYGHIVCVRSGFEVGKFIQFS